MKIARNLFLFSLIIFVQQLSAQDTIKKINAVRKLYDRKIFFDKSLDSKTIDHAPYTNLDKLRLFNSPAVYYGNSYQIQGLSSSNNNCYLDGMLVGDISLFPQSAIMKYNMYAGFCPIENGNSASGFVDVETLSPPEKTTFSIDVLGDFTTNISFSMNQKGLYFTFNSPLTFLKSIYKNKNVQPSILIAGNMNFTKDLTPSYIGVTTLDNDSYAQISENPLVPTGNGMGTFSAGEFITEDNLARQALKRNAKRNSFNPYLKLILPVTANMRISLGSYINLSNGTLDVYNNSVLNSALNPEIKERNYYNYLRFDDEYTINSNLKLKYNIQINYTHCKFIQQSAQHKDNFFNYGYVGKFTSHRTKTYEYGYDEVTGLSGHIQNGYADTLVTFEPSDINPIISNYTESYYDIYPDPNNHYQNLDQIQLGGGLINGVFLGRDNIYGLYTNVGMPYDAYQKSDFSRLNPKAQIAFDYKSKHHFILGFELDRTSTSSYTINPNQLWQLMRMQTNKHIMQLDYNNPHVVVDNYGVYQDTIWYDNLYNAGEQSFFDKNLREKLGLPVDGTEWIDIDSYSPETFSIDMFSADELLNNGEGILDYYGYDYAGNKLKGKGNYDFFSDMNTNGLYSRNIGAFKPIYLDAYVQYTYTGKRLSCNVGFRFDRYDANQPVLKDPYLLFDAKTAEEVTDLGPHPENIGPDYVVYVDNSHNPTSIAGYRNGDTWYNSQGTEIHYPTFAIAPYLEDLDQQTVNSSAFTDYKPVLNYLPLINIDYLVTRTTQIFGDFQMLTQNPTYNNFRPDQYYFVEENRKVIITNPDLKPQKITVARIGARQMILKTIQAEVFYQYKNVKGLPVFSTYSFAYPIIYFTIKNAKDDFINHSIDVSLMYKKQGRHEFNIGIYYERLLSENKKFDGILLSNNVLNGVVQYSINKSFISGAQPELKPIFSVSLASHYRSDTYFPGTNNELFFTVEKTKLPSFYYFDIKIEKPFYFGKRKDISASFYLAVQNIFNKKNVFFVYSGTEKTDDDGYLTDPNFQTQINAQTSPESYATLYKLYLNNYNNYDIPRMLIFGFSFNL